MAGRAYNESIDFSGTQLCNSAASCAAYIPNLPATGFVLTRGELPAGLSLVNGQITGTPAAKSSGNYSFVVCSSNGCDQYFLTIQIGQVVSSGEMDALTTLQKSYIQQGTVVTTSDSRRWVYTGTGDKNLMTSYIDLPAYSMLTFGGVLRSLRSLKQGNVLTARRLSWSDPVEGMVTFSLSGDLGFLMVTWPGMRVRVDELVNFFAVTGSLPGGIQAGFPYFVSFIHSTDEWDKFAISTTPGGQALKSLSLTSGTFKARLNGRASRGGSGRSDIYAIRLSLSDGDVWDSEVGSMMLWGVQSGTSTRLLKAEDIDYADLSARDWLISGVQEDEAVTVPQEGTLRTEMAINHRLVNGAMLANWPSGGEVLVDLDGRSAVAVHEATLGELTIAPGYTRNLRISMLSHLDGVPGWGNLCSLYIKFFATHASSGIDAYRSGGGDEWTEVLAFGPPSLVGSEVSVPVAGAFAVYKLVRGPFDGGVVSVSLRMRLI